MFMSATPSSVDPHGDIARRIEELHAELTNNQHEQERVRHEIDNLRALPETDPDVLRAIQEHEELLEQHAIERRRMEDELAHIRDQQ
jgi:predicted nuclease with TOPRIM domain